MKRRADRNVLRFPVRLVIDQLNGQPVSDSYLVDISSLGAQVESPVSLPLRAPLEVMVRFPWEEKPTRLSGLVKWVKPIVGRPGRFRLGLKFHQVFWTLDLWARQGKFSGASISR